MTLRISGRHMQLTPSLREHAEAKALKLAKYLDLVTEVDVVFSACRNEGKRSCAVEMIADTRHLGRFVAKAVGDAYSGVDGCFKKLERLLSESKQKLKNPKGLSRPRGD
jgi:putative sigma-54 modulation protein